MPRVSVWSYALLMGLASCAGDKEEADDPTDSGSPTDSGAASDLWDGANCPPEVPEEYQMLWDCKASQCGGDDILYHRATGTSDADGNFDVVEQWFIFRPSGDDVDYCVEDFALTGDTSAYSVDTFNCVTCEEIYDITWDMETDNNCGLKWGSLFFGEDGEDWDPPYNGVMLFDTHNSFGDRNPDDAMLVYGYPIRGNSYYDVHAGDYGRGTASPTSDADGPPETYEWSSSGICLGSG